MTKIDKDGGIVLPVKLKDIVDRLEEINDEWLGFFNTKNGEIIMIGREYLDIAEEYDEEDDFDNYQDWEREYILEAVDILENMDIYKQLPDKYSIDEYRIMEKFSYLYHDESVSPRLCSAIKGRGAFRCFKDLIIRLGIEEEWYKYKEEALFDIAREWCDSREIPYI